jgi:dihydroxy-acid dehydratase
LDLNSVFEAVGQFASKKISELSFTRLNALLVQAQVLARYVHRQFYELSFGISRSGFARNGTIPAVYPERIELARAAGTKIVDLCKTDLTIRKILTKKAFENALAVDMALGCSTNSALHLPAIAHEAGIEITLELINKVSARVAIYAI